MWGSNSLQSRNFWERLQQEQSSCLPPNYTQLLTSHRYIKPLFLVLGRGLAQFKRYLNIIKCVLECTLDLHIYPFSRTKGGKIFREYLIYCFWVRLSGRKSHQLLTKLQFSPINMTDKLFEKLSNQSNSNLTWPGAFKQPFLLIMAKTSKIKFWISVSIVKYPTKW